MTDREKLIADLKATCEFFFRTLRVFDEGDSMYVPVEGAYHVAAHVHHVADTVDWFREAAFGKGWDMDFEEDIRRAREAKSLKETRRLVEEAFARVEQAIAGASEADLAEEIPDKALMPGTPRSGIVSGIVDHTAHHRGALAVYARLRGKEPPMPYMDT